MYYNSFSDVFREFADARFDIKPIETFNVGDTNRRGYVYVQNEMLYKAKELYDKKRSVLS